MDLVSLSFERKDCQLQKSLIYIPSIQNSDINMGQ